MTTDHQGAVGDARKRRAEAETLMEWTALMGFAPEMGRYSEAIDTVARRLVNGTFYPSLSEDYLHGIFDSFDTETWSRIYRRCQELYVETPMDDEYVAAFNLLAIRPYGSDQ